MANINSPESFVNAGKNGSKNGSHQRKYVFYSEMGIPISGNIFDLAKS